jgi:ADP-heptose:LPS heptosyltransferase
MESSGKDKILIVRFSSIGDIVLTTPIVRSLRVCRPNSEIHFLTKASYLPLLLHNPHLDRVIGFEGDFEDLLRDLRAEGYSFILDLHGSLRSRLLRFRMGLPSAVYSKDRWPILMYTRFRLGRLPSRHTVERYGGQQENLACWKVLP